MGKDNEGKAAGGNVGGNAASSGAVTRKKPVRKVYEHEMTSAESYALQTVQRATSGLRTINDAIKSGKPVNPEVVKLCHQLNMAIGDMLFASA